MKSLLLAIDATQIILIVFIVVLLIAYPIMMYTRNKKENQRMQEQTNSLKRGDKVLTTSGVYGTVVDLHYENEKKIVTIETGMGKNKGYMSVDAYAIYSIFRDEEPVAETEQNKEEVKTEQPKEETKAEEVFENKENLAEKTNSEQVQEEVKEEQKSNKQRKKK